MNEIKSKVLHSQGVMLQVIPVFIVGWNLIINFLTEET